MNKVFTAKFLQHLNKKKADNKEKGFTLIELLVVVIIIGVLAAVALPNLLAQVGKARETEGKNAVGTINRGQQAYHFDATTFTVDINDTELAAVANPLGVAIDSQYYTFSVVGGSNASAASVSATPVAAQKDGVRNYAGAIAFSSGSGLYGTVVCQGSGITVAPTPTASTTGAGSCTSGTVLK